MAFPRSMVNLPGHTLRESQLFLSQHPKTANSWATKKETSCLTPLSMFRFNLAWANTGLVHTITTNVS